jgi:hypothetical protein
MRFNQLSLIGVIILVLFSFSIIGAEELNSCDNANSNTFCHHKLNIFYKAGTASYTGAKMLSSGKLEVNGGTFLWTWGDMADDEIAKSLVTVEQWKWAQSSYCVESNACTKENFDAKKTFPPQGGSSVDQSSYDTMSLNCPDNTVVKGLLLNYQDNQFMNGIQLVCVNRNNQNEQTGSSKVGTSDESFKLLRCPDSKLMTGYRLLRDNNDIFSLRLECDKSLDDGIELNIKDPTDDAKIDASKCDLLSSITNLVVNVQKSDSKLIEFVLSEDSCSSAGPSNKKKTCENLKIGIVGASNVVRGNSGGTGWIQQLRIKCPTSTFIVSAKGGEHSLKQYQNKFPELKSKTNNLKDLDILIISPSGNNIPNQDNPPYCFQEKVAIDPVKSMAQEAKSAGVKKVVVFNVNSRDNKQKACVKPYNDRLAQVVSSDSNIDQLIDIYTLLDDPSNPGTCKYCSSSDQLHWRIPDGQNIVSLEVYSKLFQGVSSSQKGAGTKVSAGGKTFSSATFQGTDSERELDEVWNRISGFVGTHSGDVFYQNKWQPYLVVYGSSQSDGGPSQLNGASSGGKFTCNNPDLSKLPTSYFTKCARFTDKFKKSMKEVMGTEDHNILLSLMSIAMSESGCRTKDELEQISQHKNSGNYKGGIMQVDGACRNKAPHCPTVDEQIKAGVTVFNNKLNSITNANPKESDKLYLTFFAYNRGEGTAKKAIQYLNQGKSMDQSLDKACHDFYPNSKLGQGTTCGPGGNTNRCCEIGVNYPKGKQTHFKKGCESLGGTVGSTQASLAGVVPFTPTGSPNIICHNSKECAPICAKPDTWKNYKDSNVARPENSVKVPETLGIKNGGSPDAGIKRHFGFTGIAPTHVLPSMLNPLKKAGEIAAQKGYVIKTIGGLRTIEHQIKLACNNPKGLDGHPRTVARPGGSPHGKGNGIDLILLKDGKKVSACCSTKTQNNQQWKEGNKILAEIMIEAGWKRLISEAWHFEVNMPGKLELTRTVSNDCNGVYSYKTCQNKDGRATA